MEVCVRVLVTGGAGFVGRHLVRRLLADGHDVTVVDLLLLEDKPDGVAVMRRLFGADAVRLWRADVGDGADVRSAFAQSKPDAVYHLAAESHVDKSIVSPGATMRTNAVGTQVVAEACVRADVPMLYCSTDEVYGDSCVDLGRANVESDPMWPSSPYSASKAAGEMAVHAAARTFGLRAVITRACNAFGPEQYPEKLIPIACRKLSAGKAVPVHGDGSQVRQWIHVDEFVAGMIACFGIAASSTSERVQTFNLAGPVRASVLDVVDALAASCVLVPPSAARFVADRPGQDRAYAIDGGKAERALGFVARRNLTDEHELRALIAHYGVGPVSLAKHVSATV